MCRKIKKRWRKTLKNPFPANEPCRGAGANVSEQIFDGKQLSAIPLV